MSERGARALELAVDALKRIESHAPVGSQEADSASSNRFWRGHARHLQWVARKALADVAALAGEAQASTPEGGDAA